MRQKTAKNRATKIIACVHTSIVPFCKGKKCNDNYRLACIHEVKSKEERKQAKAAAETEMKISFFLALNLKIKRNCLSIIFDVCVCVSKCKETIIDAALPYFISTIVIGTKWSKIAHAACIVSVLRAMPFK